MSVYLPRAEQIAAMLKGGQTVQDIANEILSWRNLKSVRINAGAVSEDWGVKGRINHPDYLGCLYQLAEELHDAGIKLIWTVPRFMWGRGVVLNKMAVVFRIIGPEGIEECIAQHRNAGCRFEHISALHLNEPFQKVYGFENPKEAGTFFGAYSHQLVMGWKRHISVDYRYPAWRAIGGDAPDHHIYGRPYDWMVCVRNLMAAQEDKTKGDNNVIITELGYWPTPRGESVIAEHIWTPEGIKVTKGLVEIAERITGELCLICAGPWNFLDYEPGEEFLKWLREKP